MEAKEKELKILKEDKVFEWLIIMDKIGLVEDVFLLKNRKKIILDFRQDLPQEGLKKRTWEVTTKVRRLATNSR